MTSEHMSDITQAAGTPGYPGVRWWRWCTRHPMKGTGRGSGSARFSRFFRSPPGAFEAGPCHVIVINMDNFPSQSPPTPWPGRLISAFARSIQKQTDLPQHPTTCQGSPWCCTTPRGLSASQVLWQTLKTCDCKSISFPALVLSNQASKEWQMHAQRQSS